jgi:hypothetical protein
MSETRPFIGGEIGGSPGGGLVETSITAGNRFHRALLVAAGTLSVSLGVVGALVPILPTTPFLLLAAACYARSSKRMHRWLFTNRLFGEYLRRYRDGEGLPLAYKLSTLVLLWTTLGLSILLAVPGYGWWLSAALCAMGLGVTAHILRIKTRRRATGSASAAGGTDNGALPLPCVRTDGDSSPDPAGP